MICSTCHKAINTIGPWISRIIAGKKEYFCNQKCFHQQQG